MDEFQREVIETLAELRTGFQNLSRQREEDQQDAVRERAEGANSRMDLHRKLDETNTQVYSLRQDVYVATQTSAQARDEVKALYTEVKKNADLLGPILQQANMWRNAWRAIFWLSTGGATIIIAVGVALGGSIRQLILFWLGIH